MSLLFALTAFVATAATQCTRDFLQSRADAYIDAQRAGNPSLFTQYAGSNFTYVENNVAMPPNSSNITLTYPLHLDYNYTLLDPTLCATFTELLSASSPHPYGIHTRIEYNPTTLTPTLLESVVTDRGDWLFNATTALHWITLESWPRLPPSARSPRAYLQHIGDLYFDRFANASVVIPWGLPCSRIEGGLYANGTWNATAGNCEQSLPSTITVPYRRYVVDEVVGAVDVFVGFPGLDRTQGKAPMADSHLMRVEEGKIRYMHTASQCVVPGCGEFDPDDPLCEAEGRCKGN